MSDGTDEVTRAPLPTDVFRKMVPTEITVPCEYSSAVISIGIEIDADTVRVVAPGLEEIQAACARGTVEVVRSYCELWTRWLVRSERGPTQ